MVFSSIIFLFLFLPLVLAGYFLLKIEYRNIFLLIVSLAFYMVAKPKFILVLININNDKLCNGIMYKLFKKEF